RRLPQSRIFRDLRSSEGADRGLFVRIDSPSIWCRSEDCGDRRTDLVDAGVAGSDDWPPADAVSSRGVCRDVVDIGVASHSDWHPGGWLAVSRGRMTQAIDATLSGSRGPRFFPVQVMLTAGCQE